MYSKCIKREEINIFLDSNHIALLSDANVRKNVESIRARDICVELPSLVDIREAYLPGELKVCYRH